VIAIVVLTHNRVHLLRRCVENVLLRTSELTQEVVIWDNASSDGTAAYLDSLDDARTQVVHNPENVAMNALPRAIGLTTAPYVIELDDDVVEAPERWDETLLDAYRRLPEIGFLCASIAYDPDDAASRYLHFMREQADAYRAAEVNGVRILRGSVGGACTMTSRELYERVGGVKENKKLAYWRPDIPYQRAIRRLGYDSAFLADLEVRHEGGPSYSEPPAPKLRYHEHESKLRERKDAAKRLILALPFAAALNRRFRWFDPPAPPYDPETYDPDSQSARSSSPTEAS
jgi:GT2 family glycosyltransferase